MSTTAPTNRVSAVHDCPVDEATTNSWMQSCFPLQQRHRIWTGLPKMWGRHLLVVQHELLEELAHQKNRWGICRQQSSHLVVDVWWTVLHHGSKPFLVLGNGVWLCFAGQQHRLRWTQINFAGDVVLDVVKVWHPVAFKHGKAVLKIILSRHHRKRLWEFLPLESSIVLIDWITAVMPIDHVGWCISDTQPEELACCPGFRKGQCLCKVGRKWRLTRIRCANQNHDRFMQHLEQIWPPRRIEEVPWQLRNCDLQSRPLTQWLQNRLCLCLARLLWSSFGSCR